MLCQFDLQCPSSYFMVQVMLHLFKFIEWHFKVAILVILSKSKYFITHVTAVELSFFFAFMLSFSKNRRYLVAVEDPCSFCK